MPADRAILVNGSQTAIAPFFWMPEETAGTVFDPFNETFGPIMHAIQAGEFERAIRGLTRLVEGS
jgi:hypothetical protein